MRGSLIAVWIVLLLTLVVLWGDVSGQVTQVVPVQVVPVLPVTPAPVIQIVPVAPVLPVAPPSGFQVAPSRPVVPAPVGSDRPEVPAPVRPVVPAPRSSIEIRLTLPAGWILRPAGPAAADGAQTYRIVPR